MRYSRIQKIIDWACFSVFIYGIVFAVIPLLLDVEALFEFEVIKALFGLAIVLGWLAVVVAGVAFIFNTAMWIVNKAPWYWKSLVPLNFSFVILVMELFSYNKEMGFTIPMVIVACSFVAAWFVVSYKMYDRKLFLLIVIVPCFFSVFGYHVPLLIGALLLFVSILALQAKEKTV